MEDYRKDSVILSYDETQALLGMIQLIIFSETKYYSTDAQNDLDSKELTDIRNKIDKWWCRYDLIIRNEFKFDDYESVRSMSIDLEFDMISAIYSDEYEVDNPCWLYNVLSAWHKLDVYVERHKEFN